jgi:Rad3-related DNA helicase
VTIGAFKPVRMCLKRAASIKKRAKQRWGAQVMLCTAAAIVIDNRKHGEYNGATTRDYLLFDEADQLPSAAAMQVDMEIPANVFSGFHITVETAEQAARDLLTRKNWLNPNTRRRRSWCSEILSEPAWYPQCRRISEDGGALPLTIRCRGFLLKRVANLGSTAFVSATLSLDGSFKDFKRALGIGKESALSSTNRTSKARRTALRGQTMNMKWTRRNG